MPLRSLAFLFATLTIVCASTAPGQSGVLIGLSPGRASSQPEAPFAGYETLWVTMEGPGVRTRTIPELLVPRRSGWWRAGVAIGCSGQSGEESSITEILWTRAVSDTTDVLAPEHCADTTETPPPDSVDTEVVFRSYGSRDCVTDQYEITFVGPNHIGFRYRSGQTEACEPRGGRTTSNAYVRHLGSDSGASMTELLGPGGDRRVAETVRSNENTQYCESPHDEEPQADLYITRRAGRWRPVAFFRGWMMSCEIEQEVKAVILRSVTGPDVLNPSWTEIRRAYASAMDAFSAPTGDVVFVRAGDSLLVHAASNGTLGARRGAINLGERSVLMIQWATGPHVARWDGEIAQMLAHGLGAPRVTIPPSSAR
ncbi:MAG TPA: hypothetical protein VJ802_15180 [Gemmatimonadaceae bacterium]|nr:hypothetical protein [Gemmatimonadaceae bacterium]